MGFRVDPEEEARLRPWVRGEDRLPLYVQSDDPGNAWILIAHWPRDDRRWLQVDWVPLSPMSEALEGQVEDDIAHTRQWHRRIVTTIARVGRILVHVPALDAVGPGGARSARLRISSGKDVEVGDVFAIARRADPEGGLLRML